MMPHSSSSSSSEQHAVPAATSRSIATLKAASTPSTTTRLQSSNCVASVPYEDAFYWRKTESLRLVVQIALTFGILLMCTGKLIFNEESQNKALYWSGITSLIAWWMPSPGSSSNRGDKPDVES